MAIKRAAGKSGAERPMSSKTATSKPVAKRRPPKSIAAAKAARSDHAGQLVAVSPYPVPPRELAGKWVAWSRYQIVASGETLGEVMDRVASEGIKGASYELLPSLSRSH
jgi:hypothetical protein